MVTTFTPASGGSSRGRGGMVEAIKGAALAVAAAVLGGAGDVMEGIILVGAAGATLGWLFARVVRPLVGGLARTYAAVDSLEALPGFMRETRDRLAALETASGEAANAARGVARELDVPVREARRR